MTLRARLVIALVGMLATGMIVYGVGTYRAFANAERARLDEEIVHVLPLVRHELDQAAGRPSGGPYDGYGPGSGGGGPGGAPRRVVPGTYAELRDADGTVAARLQVADSASAPDVSGVEVAAERGRTFTTVSSLSGEGAWRLLVEGASDGSAVLVAVPTTSLDQAVRGLLVIEVVAGLVLLVALAAGSWLVLRAGLRPLEAMAAAAGTITAGSLDQRVPVAGATTEVATVGVAINEMLDELEEAFAEREATEVRLRRFVADASHELRTPLTSIQGYAELFRLGRDSAHVDAGVIARRIEEESGRMRRLVEDLLTLARLDELREPVREPLDLAVLAADACSDAVALEPGRPMRLDAPDPVPLVGDEGRLRQAVVNLVVNALRHTPAGTPIEVSAGVAGGQAVLTVRDHGPGLDQMTLERAFDRFWQADAARTGMGAGLGLSIVAAVAAAHGGTATAANAPGGGAVFTLTLPAGSADDHRRAPARHEGEHEDEHEDEREDEEQPDHAR